MVAVILIALQIFHDGTNYTVLTDKGYAESISKIITNDFEVLNSNDTREKNENEPGIPTIIPTTIPTAIPTTNPTTITKKCACKSCVCEDNCD